MKTSKLGRRRKEEGKQTKYRVSETIKQCKFQVLTIPNRLPTLETIAHNRLVRPIHKTVSIHKSGRRRKESR